MRSCNKEGEGTPVGVVALPGAKVSNVAIAAQVVEYLWMGLAPSAHAFFQAGFPLRLESWTLCLLTAKRQAKENREAVTFGGPNASAPIEAPPT